MPNDIRIKESIDRIFDLDIPLDSPYWDCLVFAMARLRGIDDIVGLNTLKEMIKKARHALEKGE